jgi:hypothetical protein
LTCTIFSDCLSGIQTLTTLTKKDDLCCRIIEGQRDYSEINLSWIKGHSNELGNNLADSAAKEAIVTGKHYKLSMSKAYFKNIFKQESINSWMSEWKSSKKGRSTYYFFKTPSLKRLLCNFNSNQIYTNHGFFPDYFERFKLRIPKPSCICGDYAANNLHYIYVCHATLHITYQLVLDNSEKNRHHVFNELGKYISNFYRSKPSKIE